MSLSAGKFYVNSDGRFTVTCAACKYVTVFYVDYGRGQQSRACDCGAHYVVSEYVRSESENAIRVVLTVERRIVNGQPEQLTLPEAELCNRPHSD